MKGTPHKPIQLEAGSPEYAHFWNFVCFHGKIEELINTADYDSAPEFVSSRHKIEEVDDGFHIGFVEVLGERHKVHIYLWTYITVDEIRWSSDEHQFIGLRRRGLVVLHDDKEANTYAHQCRIINAKNL